MSIVLLAAMLAADPALAGGNWLGNDVLASADGKLIFARGKDGIEAIELSSGRVLWKTKGVNHVAGASGSTVVAWDADPKKPNTFGVALLDATTGKMLLKADGITMPEWATAEKQGGRSFRTGARVEGDKVVLVWQANAFYFGGAAPSPEILAAARKEALGVVLIDSKTGKKTIEDRKPKEDEFGALNNKVGALEFQVEEQIPQFKPGAPMVTKVTLTALKDGKAVWTRELAGNPWSPPPP